MTFAQRIYNGENLLEDIPLSILIKEIQRRTQQRPSTRKNRYLEFCSRSLDCPMDKLLNISGDHPRARTQEPYINQRLISMAAAREALDLPQEEIANLFMKKAHRSIYSAEKRVQNLPELREKKERFLKEWRSLEGRG